MMGESAVWGQSTERQFQTPKTVAFLVLASPVTRTNSQKRLIYAASLF